MWRITGENVVRVVWDWVHISMFDFSSWYNVVIFSPVAKTASLISNHWQHTISDDHSFCLMSYHVIVSIKRITFVELKYFSFGNMYPVSWLHVVDVWLVALNWDNMSGLLIRKFSPLYKVYRLFGYVWLWWFHSDYDGFILIMMVSFWLWSFHSNYDRFILLMIVSF